MAKSIATVVFLSFLFYFCNRKQYICPAYNTYFIHDDKEREKMFLPFNVDSLGENQTIENSSPDSTNYTVNHESGSSSKYQPKSLDANGNKKLQPNGLVINTSGKRKPRNVTDIEMRTIIAKPTALYSNIDSASFKAQTDSMSIAPRDTL